MVFTGNTRVITQTALQKFQEEMGKVVNDPYQVREGRHFVIERTSIIIIFRLY